MLKAKRVLSFVLTLALLMSMCAFVTTAQAAEVDTSAAEAETAADVSSASKITSPSDFSWDNANVYFLLTDRFYNGNTSNDHSYDRSLNQSGKVTNGNSDAAAFHGGDFAGITKKIEEGYFNDLGVNALWISAPYEQIHGYCIAGSGKSGSFPHYSYHGYYALDFSQTDANFGTAEEFEKMVDTAHKNGLRVVLDVVMNHVGYNTLKDMSEYGFGTLKSGWETGYYNATLTNVTYHQYVDYNSNASDWAKWWGSSWLRAGLAGYTEGSGDLEGCQTYLPDLKENVTSTVDIPQVLKTKWTKEGTLASKQAELNSYFSSTGKTRNVRNYLVYWLSQWVEKYGIDGFRCDTAKHVTLDSWKALKDQSVESLKKWRQNNPTKPGADWDEDFWMTGECYTHYLSYDSYYTQGGFDSMINFSFNDQNSFNASASGVPAVGSINSTYADYAGKLNTNDNYNVLTYLSSHDTRLCRSNMIYQGSAFQLMPGGIQIYYGDETNRPLATGLASGNDHALRSDMNWSSIDRNLLAHWQKVGTFRNNHVAVGAGSHTTLSATSGAAFARTYNKNGVSDKIVACIGASNNTSVTITLNGTFADGTVLKNTYDNTTATVSGGKVTFNSGANGTILLEADGQTPTTVPTTAAPTTAVPTTVAPTTEPASTVPPTTSSPVYKDYIYGDVDLDNRVTIFDVTTLQLINAKKLTPNDIQNTAADVNNDGYVDINDATLIQMYLVDIKDSTSRVGKTFKVEVPTTVAPTTVPQPTTAEPTTAEPTTAPQTEPVTTEPVPTETTPSGEVIKFTDNQNWGQVYAYFFSDSQIDIGGEWPGTAMTWYETNEYGNGNYTIDIPSGATKVVFNNGTDQTVDITLSGAEGYYTDGTRTDGKLNAFVWGDTPITTDPVPTETTPSGEVIKFTDNQNWGKVYAYFFSDSQIDIGGAWPGTAMTWYETNEYGNGNYTIDIPSGATKVVFSDGTDSNKTVDVTLSGVEGYYTDGTKTDGNFNVLVWGDTPITTDPVPTETTPSGEVIKFTDNQNWGKVYAYFFSDSQIDIGGAWPGTAMTWYETNEYGNGNYTIDIPSGATKVVFSDGTDSNKTVDVTLSGVEGYYTDGTKTDGNFNVLVWGDTPITTDPVPTETTPSGEVIKFTDNQNWGKVYAYFFSDSQIDIGGAWPGTAMTWYETNEYGNGNYTIDIPSGATKVVFSDGTDSNKTVDVTLSGVEGYYTDGTKTDGKLNVFVWGDTPITTDPIPTETTPSGEVIKFTDNQNWGKVYAYFWSDSQIDIGGAWPGTAMTWYETNEYGNGNYTIDIPSGATKVVFSDGTDSNKTVDVTLSGVEGYYTDGTKTDGKLNVFVWGDTPVTTDPTTEETTAASGNTVKFTDNQKWGKVYAYFFSDSQIDIGGAWPGNAMTFLETNGYGESVYICDVPSGATKVVFSNGSGTQTVDTTLGSEGYYTDGSKNNGKYVTKPWA